MSPEAPGIEAIRETVIKEMLKELDDHEILQNLPETNENSAQLRALRNGRFAFNEWKITVKKVDQFSRLSAREKQAFLKMLKHVYCPKCLEEIDFQVQVRYYMYLMNFLAFPIRFKVFNVGCEYQRISKCIIGHAISLWAIRDILLWRSQHYSKDIGQTRGNS